MGRRVGGLKRGEKARKNSIKRGENASRRQYFDVHVCPRQELDMNLGKLTSLISNVLLIFSIIPRNF